MLTKILITLGVIAAIYLLFIKGKRALPPPQAQHPGRVIDNEPDAPTVSRLPSYAAFGAVLVLLVISGVWILLQWQAGQQVYSVQVTNTSTGESSSYHVKRDDIEGRRFTTIDGVIVTLADTELMEVVGQ